MTPREIFAAIATAAVVIALFFDRKFIDQINN